MGNDNDNSDRSGGDQRGHDIGDSQREDSQRGAPQEAEALQANGNQGYHGKHRKRTSPSSSMTEPTTICERTEFYKPSPTVEEKNLLKKLDRRLVLFLALLYLLSFLDRSNIGNARIAGLEEDLRLDSVQYEWLLTSFYITYVLFEWMTIMYRLVPPHIYISICVFSWGLLASLQSVTTSFTSLLIIRALLGVTEAAFGPGVPFYLSFFYRRDELALRTGLFISAAPLATSFASSLAWLITKLGQGGPLAPWRLLFLVEGFPSVVVAVVAWNFIPDGPESVQYLTGEERKMAVLRLKNDDGTRRHTDMPTDVATSKANGNQSGRRDFSLREALQTLADPKCYLTAMMFFSSNVAFSSMPVFLPTIINEMGFSSITSQALSAPPYIFSFLLVLVTAYISDRFRNRSVPIFLHASLACFGYTVVALGGYFRLPAFFRYCALYPAAAGFFSAITLIITWTLNNQPSDSKKGTGMAILNIIGQCGPLLGTKLYPDEDGPYYVRGMAICACFMAVVALLAVGLRFVLARENQKTLGRYSRGADIELRDFDQQGDEEPLVEGRRDNFDGEQFQYVL